MPLLSATLLLALGLLVLHGRHSWRAGLRPAGLATAWATGLATAVPVTLLAGFAGLPVGTLPFLLLLSLLVAASWALGARAAAPLPAPGPLPEPRWLTWTARAALTAALLAVAWKLLAVAPWSWDHVAIWGVKARWIAAQGSFDLAFLGEPQLSRSNPHYPLGLPVAWLLLGLGEVPGPRGFQLAHLAFVAALLATVHGTAARLSRSPAVAALAAGLVALSPLCWDSESAGLADLPLAFFAVAAVGLLATASDLRRLAAAGLLVGFLPWVKDEGLPLAAGLLAVGLVWLWRRRRARPARLAAFAVPAVALPLLARGVAFWALPAGRGFFAGDWTARVAARWSELPALLAEMGRELADPGFLALWFVFPLLIAAAALAARRRPEARLALLLLLAVAVQLALYGFTFLASVHDPMDHVRSALYRTAAALVPLVAVAAAALAAGRPSDRVGGTMSDKTSDKPHLNPIDYLRDFAAGLSYPKLFFLTAAIFLADFFLLDPLPFVDEALLGLLTLMLSRFKKRKEDRPKVKNVTPE